MNCLCGLIFVNNNSEFAVVLLICICYAWMSNCWTVSQRHNRMYNRILYRHVTGHVSGAAPRFV